MRFLFRRRSQAGADLTREAVFDAVRKAERIFICYAHADLRIARWIRGRVVRLRRPRSSDTVFLDQDSLVPGTPVTREMVEAALARADLALLICGATTAERREVAHELNIALERRSAGHLRLIPVIVKPHVPLPAAVDYSIQGIFINRLFPERTYTRLAVSALLLTLAVLSSIGVLWGLPRWRHERAIVVLKQYGAEVNDIDDGLKVVFFAGTQFKDAATAELLPLQRLHEIDLSETNVTDEGLRALQSLGSVHTVNLAETSIGDAGMAYISAMPGLRSLTVNNCQRISSSGFARLRELRNLTSLNADDTAFSDRDLEIVPSTPALAVLSLDNTAVTDAGLIHLKGADKLLHLYLDGTAVSDAGLSHLSSLKALRTLTLSRTNVEGDGLSHLADLKDLRELRLRDAQVADTVGAHLLKLANLRSLDLSRTPLASATLRDIGRLEHLTNLYLIDVKSLTDETVTELASLSQLRELYIGGTLVGDQGLAQLGKMPSLRTLWMVMNPVTDAGILALLATGTKLQELNVNDTQVSDAAMAQANKSGRLRVVKQQP